MYNCCVSHTVVDEPQECLVKYINASSHSNTTEPDSKPVDLIANGFLAKQKKQNFLVHNSGCHLTEGILVFLQSSRFVCKCMFLDRN